MKVIEAIILGIVQGLTEFLPVSSSGHLSIVKALMGVDLESNLFMNVMLHIGTLVAVIICYRKLIARLIIEFFSMIKDIFTGKFTFKKMNDSRNMIFMLIIALLPLFLLFIPLPFTDGVNLKDLAEVFGTTPYLWLVGASLILTSVFLTLGIILNKYNIPRNRIKTRYNAFDALVVGIAQCFAAVLSGFSRSGSTLAVGQMRGIDKQTALDFSFVLGIPSIFAAAVLELKDAVSAEANPISAIGILPILTGIVVSAVVGIGAIKLFKWMLSKDRTYIFAIYTAAVGLATVIYSFVR